MTHPAVQWTLDTIQSNWNSGSFADIPLERIDRDNSTILEGDVREITPELERSNYVGAAYVDQANSPIGTEFDLEIETVVGVRIVGMVREGGEWGYVDQDASLPPATAGDPVPWEPLVNAVKDAIWRGREFPDTGETNIGFTHLMITNEAPEASAWADYYRHDMDIVLSGFETLP